MGNIITSSQTSIQVKKDFNKIWLSEQDRRTRYYEPYFDIKDAEPGATYKEGRMAELGMAPRLFEGQRPQLLVPKEGNIVERGYIKRGLSIELTEERMSDDLHGTWKQLPGQLSESIEEALEYDAAGLLELGHTANLGEDGVTVFHNAHPLINSTKTINNVLATTLSTTTMQAIVSYGQNLLKENGFLMPVRFKGLIVHPDDVWAATDLLKATGRVWDYQRRNSGDVPAGTGTAGFPAAQADNQMRPGYGLLDQWQIFPNPYLTIKTRGYALFEGYQLCLRWKYRPRLRSDADQAGTDNLIYTSKARYGLWINKYKFLLAYGPTS